MIVVGYKINNLFTKPVYQVDFLLNNKLNYYEKIIKKHCVNLNRNDYHYVNSSYLIEELHTKKEFDNFFTINSMCDYFSYYRVFEQLVLMIKSYIRDIGARR